MPLVLILPIFNFFNLEHKRTDVKETQTDLGKFLMCLLLYPIELVLKLKAELAPPMKFTKNKEIQYEEQEVPKPKILKPLAFNTSHESIIEDSKSSTRKSK